MFVDAQLNPPASGALKRMHMLAADPGIIAVMNKVIFELLRETYHCKRFSIYRYNVMYQSISFSYVL